MANTKKPADEGFLTTAAQAIGSTLGQLAKKAGVATPAPAKAAAKKAVKKVASMVKKTPAKKKAAVKKKS